MARFDDFFGNFLTTIKVLKRGKINLYITLFDANTADHLIVFDLPRIALSLLYLYFHYGIILISNA